MRSPVYETKNDQKWEKPGGLSTAVPDASPRYRYPVVWISWRWSPNWGWTT